MAQKIAMTVPMMRMAPGFCTRAQSSINGMLPRIAARPGKSTQMNGEIPEMNIGIIVRMKYRAKKMPVVMEVAALEHLSGVSIGVLSGILFDIAADGSGIRIAVRNVRHGDILSEHVNSRVLYDMNL